MFSLILSKYFGNKKMRLIIMKVVQHFLLKEHTFSYVLLSQTLTIWAEMFPDGCLPQW